MDFFKNVFEYGFDKTQFVESLTLSSEEIAHVYQVCHALCFVDPELYDILLDVVKQLERNVILDLNEKWTLFDIMIRGLLRIHVTTPNVNMKSLNYAKYSNLRGILLITSSWKWQQWCFKNPLANVDQLFTVDQWITDQIRYVPVGGNQCESYS